MLFILAEKREQAGAYAKALKGDISKINPYILRVDHSKILSNFDGILIGYLSGNIYEPLEPEEYDSKFKTWSLNTLPILPEQFKFRLKDNYEVLREKLVSAINQCDDLILATDGDREGEILGYIFLKQNKLSSKVHFRVWSNSLSTTNLQKAFQNLHDPKETYDLAIAGASRIIADWLLGINYSRLATIRLQEKKYDGNFSVGRVQTPLLKIIANKRNERKNFIKKSYLRVKFIDSNGLNFLGDKKKTLFSKANKIKAGQLIQNLELENPIITSVTTSTINKPAAKLVNTGDVQGYLVQHTNISSKQALNDVLEPLYNNYNAITYPRVEPRLITVDDFFTLRKNLNYYIQLYEKITNRQLPDVFHQLNPRERFVDISGKKLSLESHTAIILDKPIAYEIYEEFSPNLKLAYLYILETTLGMFADDFLYTNFVIEIQNKDITFTSNFKQPLKKLSWQDINVHKETRSKKTVDPKESINFDLKQYTISKEITGRYELYTENNKPSTPITEANLIKTVMPKYNLGTQATRAEIIQSLLDRKLIKAATNDNRDINLVKREYFPTEKGIVLLQEMSQSNLLNLAQTNFWENSLTNIAKGESKSQEFLNTIKQTIIEEVKKLPSNDNSVPINPKYKENNNLVKTNTNINCPKCQKDYLYEISLDQTKMNTGNTIHYNFYSCGSRKCDFKVSKNICNVELNNNLLSQIINGTMNYHQFTNKKEKTFNAKLIYSQGKIRFEFLNNYKKHKKHTKHIKIKKY